MTRQLLTKEREQPFLKFRSVFPKMLVMRMTTNKKSKNRGALFKGVKGYQPPKWWIFSTACLYCQYVVSMLSPLKEQKNIAIRNVSWPQNAFTDGALPRTPLGELAALPVPPSWIAPPPAGLEEGKGRTRQTLRLPSGYGLGLENF